jgi:hypothetical protein
MDIEDWKRRLEGSVPEEWCPGVECDGLWFISSSLPVRVIRVHRFFGDVFYAVCIYCLKANLALRGKAFFRQLLQFRKRTRVRQMSGYRDLAAAGELFLLACWSTEDHNACTNPVCLQRGSSGC